MQFRPPHSRRPHDAIVPMINVVFLLLVFFMMTTQIAPPAPFEVTPPSTQAEALAEGAVTLFVSDAGDIATRSAQGDAVWAELGALENGAIVILLADAAVSVPELARLLARIGPTLNIRLVVRP